ncbi:hypothetical protein ACWEV3_31610 [Saccharopolyspora sp. NPDC003752]
MHGDLHPANVVVAGGRWRVLSTSATCPPKAGRRVRLSRPAVRCGGTGRSDAGVRLRRRRQAMLDGAELFERLFD